MAAPRPCVTFACPCAVFLLWCDTIGAHRAPLEPGRVLRGLGSPSHPGGWAPFPLGPLCRAGKARTCTHKRSRTHVALTSPCTHRRAHRQTCEALVPGGCLVPSRTRRSGFSALKCFPAASSLSGQEGTPRRTPRVPSSLCVTPRTTRAADEGVVSGHLHASPSPRLSMGLRHLETSWVRLVL